MPPPKKPTRVTANADLAGITGFRLEALPDDALPSHGPGTAPNGNFVLTEFASSLERSGGKPKPLKIARATADHSQESFAVATAIEKNADCWLGHPARGWQAARGDLRARRSRSKAEPTGQADLHAGVQVAIPAAQYRQIPAFDDDRGKPGEPDRPGRRPWALAVAPDKRSETQKASIANYYRTISPLLQAQREALAELEKKKTDLLAAVPKCLVSTAGNPRTVRILPSRELAG